MLVAVVTRVEIVDSTPRKSNGESELPLCRSGAHPKVVWRGACCISISVGDSQMKMEYDDAKEDDVKDERA